VVLRAAAWVMCTVRMVPCTAGEVGGEVGTRSFMCHRGWEVWVHGRTVLLYVMSNLI